MILRTHQSEMQTACTDILAGAPIKQIIASVTPGGGKSAMPVILASMLIPAIADKLIWVCPRDALKYQGEEEFTEPRWNTPIRLRATNGNNPNPDRGTQGYITTFQAIGTRTAEHLEYVKRFRTIIFLDEAQFIGEDGSWAESLKPILDAAVLVVFASGTIARGDGTKIAFLDYSGDLPDLFNTRTRRVITYGRKQAIAEKSILPVYGKTIDGAAEWISAEGIHRKVESIRKSGSDRSEAVFTALRTEYAFQLLNACITDWEETRKVYPEAKLLVVAPNIEYANKYHQYLSHHYLSEIATSEDSPLARRSIDNYKRGLFPILISCQMAYVGLSVPSISHIACLTQIRSVPWLEQCFARANRCAPGKTHGTIYGPADQMFLRAMQMIEEEQKPGLKDEDNKRVKSSMPIELVESVSAPKIEPLWSSALGVNVELKPRDFTESEKERVLIENIRAIRKDVLSRKRAGGIKSAENLFNLRIRAVADKRLEEMSTEELTKVWMILREKYA